MKHESWLEHGCRDDTPEEEPSLSAWGGTPRAREMSVRCAAGQAVQAIQDDKPGEPPLLYVQDDIPEARRNAVHSCPGQNVKMKPGDKLEETPSGFLLDGKQVAQSALLACAEAPLTARTTSPFEA